jgi:hypothetical protein
MFPPWGLVANLYLKNGVYFTRLILWLELLTVFGGVFLGVIALYIGQVFLFLSALYFFSYGWVCEFLENPKEFLPI